MSLLLIYTAAGKDTGQIHDALIKAGLIPLLVQSGDEVTVTPNPPGPDVVTRTPTIYLTFADGTSQAAVDAIVAAHIPQTRYVPAARLAKVRAIRQRERTRGDYERAKTQASGAATLAQLRDAVLTVLEAKRP